MLVNGDGVNDWTLEQVFTGERLYCSVTVAVGKAINEAVMEVMRAAPETFLPARHEITGIVAHALLEVAMRRIMAARMSCTLAEFEAAARFVYASCHAQEQGGAAQLQQ